MRCVVRHGALMPCPRGLPMVKLGAAPPPPAAGALTSSAQACTRPGVAPIVTLSVPVLPLARLASVPAITPLPTGLDASAYSVTPDGHVVTSTSLASLMRMTRVSPARRSEEHTSELQSHSDLVCRLLLEKKKKKNDKHRIHNYKV